MLRKIRIVLAALCFAGITLLFVGIGHGWWGWLAKLQALPTTLRVIAEASIGNIAVLLGIVLLTLLFGRIYCSVICPLGVFQDFVLWLRRTLGKWIKPLRKRFKYNKERRWLRYPVAALLIGCIIADLQLVIGLLEPYSAYGRIVRSIAGGGPAPLLIAAGVTLLVVTVCAALWGRAYCNNFCPVGTLLGCISRFSVFGIKVDENKCGKCGVCSRQCKASCIEEGTLKIDRSRCVDCFDCIDSCKKGALSFGKIPGQAGNDSVDGADSGRRAFIGTGVLLLSGAAGTGLARAQVNKKVDGGLAPIEPKQALEREPRLVPPGSGGTRAFYQSCTACQLCVTACPNGVLRPSTDLEHLLQPQMGYENGFCRPECTACSEVCPAGAIRPVTKDAKTLIRIGTAYVNTELCLAAKGEAGCGACSRHCPTGAISMVDTEGVRRPVVAEEQCIGCGKCEYLCPVRPVSAITVKGLETHISK